MDNQLRQNRVHLYVCLCAHKYEIAVDYTPARCNPIVNTCLCNNGVANTAVGCPAHGAAKCESCNPGWTLNHGRTECIRTWLYSCHHEQAQKEARNFNLVRCGFAGNTCICSNGVAQTGADCPVNGAHNCESCNTGWTAGYDRSKKKKKHYEESTKCICTCAHLYE